LWPAAMNIAFNVMAHENNSSWQCAVGGRWSVVDVIWVVDFAAVWLRCGLWCVVVVGIGIGIWDWGLGIRLWVWEGLGTQTTICLFGRFGCRNSGGSFTVNSSIKV
jgi:hypothetical protein